ncbi:putative formate dehydrogenase [Mycobacteroides abscessus subsp. bolletii 50594]|uniref:Formate dehydrogenase n=1 Tax=Mycobacteroides abscessus subsp. bolletii 50594 TaxID=1303024 RepID=A0AB33AH78_9MYCO|nr:putative formate dehydrogenase [Mycobacteroides abscessus subsp. bolletii 50594]
MAKCVMVLYPDPLDGYPPKYARDSIPAIECYPDGSSLPSPDHDRLQTRRTTGLHLRSLIVEGGRFAGTGAVSYQQ